jgi:adenylylsulfate kinase-like enzyme
MTFHRFPILWLTGNTGAGKTTLANGLEQHINEELSSDHPLARRCIVLDGDDMRATISTDETLTPEDRRKHNLRVARLAAHLQSRGFLVVVAVIAPFASVREEIASICDPVWIYIRRESDVHPDRPYEAPASPDVVIDHDQLDIAGAQAVLRAFVSGRTGADFTIMRDRSADAVV